MDFSLLDVGFGCRMYRGSLTYIIYENLVGRVDCSTSNIDNPVKSKVAGGSSESGSGGSSPQCKNILTNGVIGEGKGEEYEVSESRYILSENTTFSPTETRRIRENASCIVILGPAQYST